MSKRGCFCDGLAVSDFLFLLGVIGNLTRDTLDMIPLSFNDIVQPRCFLPAVKPSAVIKENEQGIGLVLLWCNNSPTVLDAEDTWNAVLANVLSL